MGQHRLPANRHPPPPRPIADRTRKMTSWGGSMAPADDGVQAVPDASPLTVEDADGRANEIGGRSGRESRLDLLLAEELAGDHYFACWFLQEAACFAVGEEDPDGGADGTAGCSSLATWCGHRTGAPSLGGVLLTLN
jgi:hypothetical protein